MNIEQIVIKKLRVLTPEMQQEVLDFVEFIQQKKAARVPRRSVKGLWADLNIHVSEQDIDKDRGEMWDNFPREDF
ncbi:MAG TPA: hypothetical protein PKM59_12465 [Thermodesulfobacteriota bacterium]|nr:hypothetical protein [Thermodesulfobacteriota bacterium]HNU72406.1 hypothetical protein [Thermodesulfobacteriota bacterium]